MSKNTKIIIGVVIVVIIVVAGFALLHKSSNTPAPVAANSSGQSQSSTSNAPAVNNAVLITKSDSSFGQYLADPSGKPLYIYGADKSGTSNCTGACLASWPAYQATGSTANLPAGVAVITRTDNGQKQYTYNGMPLYFFTADTNGSPTGNGVDNFTLAKPAAASSSSGSSSSTSGSSNSSSSSQPSSSSSNNYPY